jgi:fucose 4-O-acetylase-like acetyltransferase
MASLKSTAFNTVNLIVFTSGTLFYFLGNASGLVKTSLLLLLGFSGLLLVFVTFFRYEQSFRKDRWIGRSLQYVGVRTLDVYLLHGLLIQIDLGMIGTFFVNHPNPLLEILVSFSLAVIVIGATLLISNICRTSDIMAKVLFGRVIPDDK